MGKKETLNFICSVIMMSQKKSCKKHYKGFIEGGFNKNCDKCKKWVNEIDKEYAKKKENN